MHDSKSSKGYAYLAAHELLVTTMLLQQCCKTALDLFVRASLLRQYGRLHLVPLAAVPSLGLTMLLKKSGL